MNAWVLCEVSEQYKRFCNLSRRRKISVVGTLLLFSLLWVVAVLWLPRLIDSRPWIGYSAGAIVFIEWMWRRGYPALKRRIVEAYREITTGGLRQVPGSASASTMIRDCSGSRCDFLSFSCSCIPL